MIEDGEIASLAAALDRRLDETETAYHRPLYSRIDWDDRLLCIKGAKGTGKTTMMLQFLKERPEERREAWCRTCGGKARRVAFTAASPAMHWATCRFEVGRVSRSAKAT